MTEISNEQLQAILDGCEGVTPGPWDNTAGLIRAIDGDDAIPIFEGRDPWKKHRRTSTVVRQAWHNLAHIARLDPDTVRAMVTELLAVRRTPSPDPARVGVVTEEMVDAVLELYRLGDREYDRDFYHLSPEGWQEKYGTNLHATSLGEKWAMRRALTAALSVTPNQGGAASCPGCNGTGWQGGNELFGACDDCGGAGAHPDPASGTVAATHRHKKRGSEYVLIGIGKMQAELWFDGLDENLETTVDMREVAIYRSVDDGELWVRPREEFEDGRFEVLAPSTPLSEEQ